MPKAEAGRWPEGREIHIVVPGKIVSWNRPIEKMRNDGSRYRYSDRESRSYVGEVKQAAGQIMAGEDPIPKDIGLVLDVLGVWAVPSSWSGRKRARALTGLIHKTTGPDIDNGIIKGVLDALQQVVFANDAQVVALGRPMKVYGSRPRLEIWVTVAGQMTEHDHPKVACMSPPRGSNLAACSMRGWGETENGQRKSKPMDSAAAPPRE